MSKSEKYIIEAKEFINESIIRGIHLGDLSKDELIEVITEEVEDNEFDDIIVSNWITNTIDQRWVECIELHKKLEKPTDVDRLEKAFTNLNMQGIKTFHNCGYNSFDGHTEAATQLLDQGVDNVGYCFYHGQSLDCVTLSQATLHISHGYLGGIEPNPTKSKEIAILIVSALKDQGLKVAWSGDPDKNIKIEDFYWIKPYNC
jgi:hypothetical protein